MADEERGRPRGFLRKKDPFSPDMTRDEEKTTALGLRKKKVSFRSDIAEDEEEKMPPRVPFVDNPNEDEENTTPPSLRRKKVSFSFETIEEEEKESPSRLRKKKVSFSFDAIEEADKKPPPSPRRKIVSFSSDTIHEDEEKKPPYCLRRNRFSFSSGTTEEGGKRSPLSLCRKKVLVKNKPAKFEPRLERKQQQQPLTNESANPRTPVAYSSTMGTSGRHRIPEHRQRSVSTAWSEKVNAVSDNVSHKVKAVKDFVNPAAVEVEAESLPSQPPPPRFQLPVSPPNESDPSILRDVLPDAIEGLKARLQYHVDMLQKMIATVGIFNLWIKYHHQDASNIRWEEGMASSPPYIVGLIPPIIDLMVSSDAAYFNESRTGCHAGLSISFDKEVTLLEELRKWRGHLERSSNTIVEQLGGRPGR